MTSSSPDFPSPPPDGLPAPARRAAAAVILSGLAVSVLDGTVVNLALPGIAQQLQVSPSHAVWVVNAYQVAMLAVLLPCSMLGELIGYRRVYLAGTVLFTLASAGCLLSTTFFELAAARAFQGFGAAGMLGVNAALVRLTYPRALPGRGIALNSVTVATATVAGPTVSAAILSVASWPWLFAVNLPLGICIWWLGHRALPRNAVPPRAGARLSGLDVGLNALMFALVVMGADGLGEAVGAGSGGSRARALVLLGLGMAVGFFYVRRQLRQSYPLLPVDLLRIPVFRLSMCTSTAVFSAQALAFISLPFLLLESYGRSHAQAGLVITAWPLATVVAAPVAGRLIGRFPDGLISGVGLALMSAGLLLLAALPAAPSNADIMLRMLVCGAGFGIFQSPNNHTIITSAPPDRAGGAGGMQNSARLTGGTVGAIGVTVLLALFDLRGGRGPLACLLVGAGFAAAAAVFSLLRLRHLPPSGH